MISPFRVVLLIAVCGAPALVPAFALPSASTTAAGALQPGPPTRSAAVGWEVGAAKVDITPAADADLPMSGYANRVEGFKGIHDHIYVRAIVLSDGSRQAAIVSWELIGVPTAAWEELSARLAKETGIQPEYLLLTAVHDHSAPSPFGMYGNNSPKSAAYSRQLDDATVEAVRKAKANLQPARVGIGTGIAHVNINRREYSQDRGWWLGYNPDGPSDKTVVVIRFDAISGKPIALLVNYPVHAVVMGPENYQITGDLAGATSTSGERCVLSQWDCQAAGANPE